MPEWLAVILYGVIEGITEFLPISSTGHLLVAERWLPDQPDVFLIGIQSGAVLAVIAIFTQRLKQLMFRWREPEAKDYLAKLAAAFAITAAGGLVLKELEWELPNEAAPIAWTLIIGGVAILIIEYLLKGKLLKDEITWKVAIVVGLSQLLAAVFPGTSRSGATILAALACGTNRPMATEFSFLLGIPTLLAAGAVKLYDAMETPDVAIDWSSLALGAVVSGITAFAVVKWLLRFVQNHTFAGFAWYRIAFGTALLILIAAGV